MLRCHCSDLHGVNRRKKWTEALAPVGRTRCFSEIQVQARGGFCSELSRQERERCSPPELTAQHVNLDCHSFGIKLMPSSDLQHLKSSQMLPPTVCVMGKAKSLTEGHGREQGGGKC